MPIFVSRFSAERIASAGLRRLGNQGQTERRERTRESQRGNRPEQNGQATGVSQNERAQDQLPVATQQAESIRDQLRNRIEARLTGSEDGTADPAPTRPTFPIQAELPGVPTVSTESGTATVASTQAGRLSQTSAQGVRSSRAGSRFSSAASARSAEISRAFQNIPSDAQNFEALQANRLDTQIDATVRLLRSRNEPSSVIEPETTADAETLPTTAAEAAEEPEAVETPAAPTESVTAGAVPVAETADQSFPTAEQISRANTTTEIQENLRSNSSEIEQGLRADAEIQAQQNQRQTAANAQRSSEASRESAIEDNEEAVRDLTVQERQLEQSLRATQSEIRDLNNESNRLESSGSTGTASSAVNLTAQASVL